jgi:hypothetical protein
MSADAVGYWVNNAEQMEEVVEGMVLQDSKLNVFRACGEGNNLERFGTSYTYGPMDVEFPARIIAINADMNW